MNKYFALMTSKRCNTVFLYRVCEHAVFPQVVMIALCLLMLFRSMLLFVCVQYTNIQFTLLFVLNARMNFRDYGNCANESPCSTIDCPQMLWFVSSYY